MHRIPSVPFRSPLNCVPIIITLFICAVMVAIAAIFTGCASSGGTGLGGKLTPERVQAIAKLATYVGVTADLKAHPEHRIAFERAGVSLQVLVDQEKWDTSAVATALLAAGVDDLQGSEGAIYITGGLMLMDSFGVGQYDLKDKEHAKAVILGIHDGLKLAMGTPAVAPTKARSTDGITVDPWEIQLQAEAVATRRLR